MPLKTISPRYEIGYHNGHTAYVLLDEVRYWSKRYGKGVTVPIGYRSDGASFIASDIGGISWWVHDWLCDKHEWDDLSYCSSWESSMVLHDILVEQGQWCRAKLWFAFVYPYQRVWRGWR